VKHNLSTQASISETSDNENRSREEGTKNYYGREPKENTRSGVLVFKYGQNRKIGRKMELQRQEY